MIQQGKTFLKKIEVTKRHLDKQNHVNNLVYLQWCLEAAEDHWEQLATSTIKTNYVWYVLNHNINYRASAYKGDTLEIKTWVSSVDGVKSERSYEIWRLKDNILLIEAKTLWCLLDAKLLKPSKVTIEIANLFI